jgi:hypothetical protein
MEPRDLGSPDLPQARERAIEALKSHYALDHIEIDELEKRLAAAQDSRSAAELAKLLEDLPALAGEQVAQPGPQPREHGELVAILGGSTRKGRWFAPRRLGVRVLLGGAELDFRDAVLPEGGTVVDVSCVLGGVEVTVPPEMPVEVEGIGILGGFEDSSRGSESTRPRLQIRGFALLGGVEVKARPRRLPDDRPRRGRLQP